MDPLTACLLLSLVVMKTFKLAKVDREYAKKGITPPGYRLAEALLERKKAAGAVSATAQPIRYGARGYARQRWNALWEDLGERHAEQRAAHKLAVADAKANGQTVPKSPSLKDRLVAGWQWAINPVGEPCPTSAPQPAGADAEPATLADLMGGTPATTPPPADGPRIACQHCGQTLTNKDGHWQHPSSAGCPHKAAETADEANGTGDTDRLDQARSAAAGDTATEGDTMTTTAQPQMSGEVTGTRSAVIYARAMAATHAAHASNEGYITSLATMEVGAGDISKVRAAMQASKNAAAAWSEAADSIDANNAALREAYAQSPDAANKAANINE